MECRKADISYVCKLEAIMEDKKRKEHEFWVKEELEEAKREKKKAQQFYKSKIKRTGFGEKAMIEGKKIHGTRGKPGHGPRGSKR